MVFSIRFTGVAAGVPLNLTSLSFRRNTSETMSANAAMKRIGTHDGKFHCDEVLACFMLKRLPEYVASEVVRTRDEAVLKTCDIVVDVGGVYDPSTNRFDHHQSTFTETMNSLNPEKPWNIKLSSAGLVYHHFGERILQAILGPRTSDPDVLPKLYDYVYETFVREIDGIDNGVPMFEGEPRYRVHTGISSRVSNLNPTWNSQEPQDVHKLFHAAMDFVGREFIERVDYFVKSLWPARRHVEDAVSKRMSVHPSGEIIELEQFCPWAKHLSEIEKEKNLGDVIKFVIFDGGNGTWRVQGVPVEIGSFVLRVPLKEEWRGKRDDELVKLSGIDGCVFVHASGFIGGNKTREGALLMAAKTLETQKVS